MARRKKIGTILTCLLVLCGIIVVVVYMQVSMLLNVSQFMGKGKHVNLRENNKEVQKILSHSLSLIVVSDISHLNKLNYAINSWLGEISVGLCVYSYETDLVDSVIHDFSFPSRVTIFQHQQKGYNFPINTLRNNAISRTKSSHIFVADIDVIPATNLREVFLSLPSSYLRDTRHAFIVPLFDTPHKSLECDRWFGCLNHVRQYTKLDKKELLWCLRFNGCRNLGEKDFNKYMPKSWETVPVANHTIPVSCWDNPFQEPLLIVANHKNLPLFDASFVDYGYNRVQWVSLLRYSGYRFSILSHTWAFHVRHVPSELEKKSKEKSDPTKGKKGGVDTHRMYENVMKKYEKEFADSMRIPICEIQNTVVRQQEPQPPPVEETPSKKPKKKRLIRRGK